MKRSNLFILTLAACAALLSACSNELDSSDNPALAGDNEAIVNVSLQFPGADKPAGYANNPAGYANKSAGYADKPAGYAGGDVSAGVALDAEKEIRSIAFIAFTTGGTSVYLSTNPTFETTGFTQPLTAVEGPAGNYTASFKIRSDDFTGKTTLVAVANFKEHDLTFDPGTLTIASLKAMLTKKLEEDASIQYPLLMTVAQEFELVEGSTVGIDFLMERIMARIDVVNNAYDKVDPANNFVLTSARLLSATSQGTMIGGQEIAAPTYVNLAVQSTIKEVLPAEGDELTPIKQQLDPMYVYENTNTDKENEAQLSATATSVEIKGIYKGKAYSKVIPFVTPEKVVGGVLEGGVIVPIARNTRYVVEVAAANENELTFDLKVTDWTEGKQLDVEIDFAPPVLEGLDGFAPTNGATWDAVTRTLNITKATTGTVINLVARGNQGNDVRVETDYDENETTLAKTLTVERGELSGYVSGYADAELGSLIRTYTITVPQVTGEYPSNTKIVIYNTSYDGAQSEITVKYTPFFVGDWVSSQSATTIDPATNLIDLKKVTDGQSGTVSFFTSSNGTMTVSPLTNKGVTNNFYSMTAVDENKKYGPGKRITLTYKALSDKPEFAEVQLTDAEAMAKKVLIKCFRKPYALVQLPNNANALSDGNSQLYLAINNSNHGSIAYTVFDNEEGAIALSPTVKYATDMTSPSWANGFTSPDITTETLSDFKVIKRTFTIALPTAIKNPAAVDYKIGIPGETALQVIPVYLSGTTFTANDKAFRPVLVKGIWWSPINIGQTKISEVNDPSSAAGYLFQWGRKQGLAYNSPVKGGPVASPEAAKDYFIKAAPDWLITKNDQLWNSGTEEDPIKTENDPCPTGWRVPTQIEANSLQGTHTEVKASTPTPNSNSILLINGDIPNTKFHLPFVGIFRCATGEYDYNKGSWVQVWASHPTANAKAGNVYIGGANCKLGDDPRAQGNSVRCVQEYR